MGLAIAELDDSAEGGVAAALAADSGLPAHMVGLGGTAADLRPFEARDLARGLVGLQRPHPPAPRSVRAAPPTPC
jgi:fused signal recognition particle receptor